MNAPTLTPDDIAADLTDDGDTFDLCDGRTLLLRIESDDASPLDDADWFGAVSPIDTWRDSRAPRPAGFDGRARKLRPRDGVYWWQPPADVPDETIPAMERSLLDLLDYGYSSVGVILKETVEDSRGNAHSVTVDAAWIGGVEPFPDPDYLATLVADLVAELLP